jgi:hypothetical protein
MILGLHVAQIFWFLFLNFHTALLMGVTEFDHDPKVLI